MASLSWSCLVWIWLVTMLLGNVESDSPESPPAVAVASPPSAVDVEVNVEEAGDTNLAADWGVQRRNTQGLTAAAAADMGVDLDIHVAAAETGAPSLGRRLSSGGRRRRRRRASFAAEAPQDLKAAVTSSSPRESTAEAQLQTAAEGEDVEDELERAEAAEAAQGVQDVLLFVAALQEAEPENEKTEQPEQWQTMLSATQAQVQVQGQVPPAEVAAMVESEWGTAFNDPCCPKPGMATCKQVNGIWMRCAGTWESQCIAGECVVKGEPATTFTRRRRRRRRRDRRLDSVVYSGSAADAASTDAASLSVRVSSPRAWNASLAASASPESGTDLLAGARFLV